MDLNNFRTYNLKKMEMIIGKLNTVFDISLEDEKSNFIKDDSYSVKYFKYFFLYNDFPDLIRRFLSFTKQEEFVFTILPWDNIDLSPMTIKGVLSDIESKLGREARILTEESLDKESFNSLEGFPLYFKNLNELLEFLDTKEEERENIFSLPAVLFPVSLNWIWFFDYDELMVVHFIFKKDLKPIIEMVFVNSNLEYTNKEMKNIRSESKD